MGLRLVKGYCSSWSSLGIIFRMRTKNATDTAHISIPLMICKSWTIGFPLGCNINKII